MSSPYDRIIHSRTWCTPVRSRSGYFIILFIGKFVPSNMMNFDNNGFQVDWITVLCRYGPGTIICCAGRLMVVLLSQSYFLRVVWNFAIGILDAYDNGGANFEIIWDGELVKSSRSKETLEKVSFGNCTSCPEGQQLLELAFQMILMQKRFRGNYGRHLKNFCWVEAIILLALKTITGFIMFVDVYPLNWSIVVKMGAQRMRHGEMDDSLKI